MNCPVCDSALGLGGKRGRLPRYCSNACRQRAYRLRRRTEIPARLRNLDRWTRADGKRPVQLDGRPASTTAPETWTTYAAVRANTTAGNGYGVMLGGGLACIDLDHALDQDGHPTDTARRVLDACPDAWVEISQSGRGLHIFGAGFEAAGRRLVAPDGTGVEIYSRDRFIRVTGNAYRPGDVRALDLDAVATIAQPGAHHKRTKSPRMAGTSAL